MQKLKYLKTFEDFTINEEFLGLFGKKEANPLSSESPKLREKISAIFPDEYLENTNDESIHKLFLVLDNLFGISGNKVDKNTFGLFNVLNRILDECDKSDVVVSMLQGEGVEDLIDNNTLSELNKHSEKLWWLTSLTSIIENYYFIDKDKRKIDMKGFMNNEKESYQFLLNYIQSLGKSDSGWSEVSRCFKRLLQLENLVKIKTVKLTPHRFLKRLQEM